MRAPMSICSSQPSPLAQPSPPQASLAVVDVLLSTCGGASGPLPARCVWTTTGADQRPAPTSLVPRTRSTYAHAGCRPVTRHAEAEDAPLHTARISKAAAAAAASAAARAASRAAEEAAEPSPWLPAAAAAAAAAVAAATSCSAEATASSRSDMPTSYDVTPAPLDVEAAHRRCTSRAPAGAASSKAAGGDGGVACVRKRAGADHGPSPTALTARARKRQWQSGGRSLAAPTTLASDAAPFDDEEGAAPPPSA